MIKLEPSFYLATPTPLPAPYGEHSPLPAVFVDPLAWSSDGDEFPVALLVKTIRKGEAVEFIRSDYYRKWQAIVTGSNAAKSKKAFLERNAAGFFKTGDLKPGTVLEVGKINKHRRASFSSVRTYFVVVEKTAHRLYLERYPTKAQALKAGNLRLALGEERKALLASRRAIHRDLTRTRSFDEQVEDGAIAGMLI